MFDKITNMPREISIRVDEHRAPTDESVRVFGEFRKEALKSVIDSATEELRIDQLYWAVADHPETNCIRIHLVFFVDGRKCKEEIRISRRSLAGRSIQERCDEIQSLVLNGVSQAVAREMSRGVLVSIASKISKALIA